MSQTVPIGAIVKVRNSPNLKKLEEQMTKRSEVEVIDITGDEDRTSKLKKNSILRVSNEGEAADASLVIQALKESVVKYYLSKIPAQMRRVLINKVMDQ